MTLHSFLKAPSSFRHIGRRMFSAPGTDTLSFRAADAGLGEARAPDWAGSARGGELAPFEPAAAGPAARHGYAIASSTGSDVLRRAIGVIDGGLSYCCGVKPFSRDGRCLLRYAAISSPGDYRLSDGTVLKAGDLVIDLHLWNEHIPPVPRQGPDLAWARLVAQWMKHSLELLAEAMRTDPAMRGAKAIRAKTNFVGWGGQSESMSRLIARFGFEDVDEGLASMPERLHDAFENILIGALTWAHNPEALRRDKLIRQRRPVWMSADTLRRRHSRG